MNVVLAGMLAGVPGQGGASWAVLQYLLGLRQLGHDVMFVEPVAAGPDRDAAIEYFGQVVDRFGLAGRAALLDPETGAAVAGVARGDLRSFARGADLLLNLSGVLADDDLLELIPVRAFATSTPRSRSSGARSRGSTWGLTATTGS